MDITTVITLVAALTGVSGVCIGVGVGRRTVSSQAAVSSSQAAVSSSQGVGAAGIPAQRVSADQDSGQATAAGPAAPAAGDALAESVAQFAVAVTPVWSGQVEATRQQMEGAVGELVERFGRIVMLLGDTIDVTNNAVGQGQDEAVEGIRGRLLDTLGALDRALQQADADPTVAEAKALLTSVLDDLAQFADAMRQTTQRLELTGLDVQQEIAQSLVHLQFQDRIGQMLEHVRDGIAAFAPLLERARAGGTGDLAPLDVEGLLDVMRSSYTMAEEHELHGAGTPLPVRETEITFF